MNICCLPGTNIFKYFSEFLSITLSSENSYQFGLTQSTDQFHHFKESWEQGEENGTWTGALRAPKMDKKTIGQIYSTSIVIHMKRKNQFLKIPKLFWPDLTEVWFNFDSFHNNFSGYNIPCSWHRPEMLTTQCMYN